MEFLTLLAALKPVVLSIIVKWLADLIKKLFIDIDENGIVQGYKGPIQVMVLAASTLVQLGNLALTGQLGSVDLGVITTSISNIITFFVGSQGIHAFFEATFKHIFNRKTLK